MDRGGQNSQGREASGIRGSGGLSCHRASGVLTLVHEVRMARVRVGGRQGGEQAQGDSDELHSDRLL